MGFDLETITGSLLGLAVGDALGFPHEYKKVSELENLEESDLKYPKEPFMKWEKERKPGQVSDDTQQSVGVAMALVIGEGEIHPATLANTMTEYYLHSRYSDNSPRINALFDKAGEKKPEGRSIVFEKAEKDFPSNGAAMRAGPLGLVSTDDNLVQNAVNASKVTHTNAQAVAAAVSVAAGVKHAAEKKQETTVESFFTYIQSKLSEFADDYEDGSDEQKQVEEYAAKVSKVKELIESKADLSTVREELKQHRWEVKKSKNRGPEALAIESVPAALYAFANHLTDPFMKTMHTGLRFAGDVDSIMSIAGAMKGAQVGAANIPQHLVEGLFAGFIGHRRLRSVAEKLHRL